MKHSILSMLLLFGIGVAPAWGLIGGGSINYPPDARNADNKHDDAGVDPSGTKGIAVDGQSRQITAENNKACAGTIENTCPLNDAKPSR